MTSSPRRLTAYVGPRRFVAVMFALLVGLVALPGVASAGSTNWLDPVRLDVDQDVSLQASAANAAGAAVAIWQDYHAEGTFAAYRSPGGTWGPPEIADPAPLRFDHQAVTIDAQGIVTLVYSRCDTCGMVARRRAADGTWSSTAVLDDLGEPDAYEVRPYRSANDPEVAVGPDGRVTAVWIARSQSGNEQSVRTSTFTGSSWSPVQTVSGALHGETEFVYDTRQAQVTFDEDGRAVIASLLQRQDMDSHEWQDNPWSITLATRPAGQTAFGSEVEIDARTATSQPEMPAVAFRDGVATVAWSTSLSDSDRYRTELRARRYDVTSGLGPVVAVSGDNVPYGHRHQDPVIDVTPAGDATLAWTHLVEWGEYSSQVLARTWNAGGTWRQQDVVTSGIEEQAGDRAYDVAAGTDGTVAVSWTPAPGSANKMAGVRLRRPDGTWTAAKALGGPDAQWTAFPFVAVESDGDALATWRAFRVDGSTQTDFVEAMATGEPPADTAGPQVTITTPAIGQRFTQGADVTVDYACTDDVQVALCEGNVPNGGKLDTSTVGQHTFTVLARDGAGRETTRTHGYFVDAPAGTNTGSGGDKSGGDQTGGTDPTGGTGSATSGAIGFAREQVSRADKMAGSIVNSKLFDSFEFFPRSTKATSVAVKATSPKTDVAVAVLAPLSGSRLVSASPAKIASAYSSSLLAAHGGALARSYAGGIVADARGNVLSTYGSGLSGATARGANVGTAATSSSSTARAHAAAAPKLRALSKGARFFAQPGSGKLKVKLTAQGRKALRRSLGKRGKQRVRVVLAVTVGQRGSGAPAVTFLRQTTVRG
jgi:hypothetical protein